MPFQKDNIFQFNHYMKSDKMSYIIYASLESLIKKIDECVSKPKKSSTTKIGEHVPCEYSMSTIWVFDTIGNKHSLYRGENCQKKFSSSLKEHGTNVIKCERKKAKITPRSNNLLHLRENILKKVC